MTDTKTPVVETFEPARPGRRRSFTTSQKEAILAEAARPGSTISAVARQYGISPSLVFRWKSMQDAGAIAGLDADEPVVAASEVKELRGKVRELERLLGKKTMENEILKEAFEVAREKNGYCGRRRPPGVPGEARCDRSRRLALRAHRRA
jgi:transposase